MRWNTYIAKLKSLFYPVKYGLLYNFYAVIDVRNISAIGWWVLTQSELTALILYLGGLSVGGGKLKETGIIYFNTPNTGATNEFGFNARGGGVRTSSGFGSIKNSGVFWTSRLITPGFARAYSVAYNNSAINDPSVGTSEGYSIRLVRPATTPELSLPDGLISATYTGNDLKVYRCCKVGSLIFIADNLAETKYRNGDWITGFDGGTYTPITNANWTAKTTEACCAYGDDLSKV